MAPSSVLSRLSALDPWDSTPAAPRPAGRPLAGRRWLRICLLWTASASLAGLTAPAAAAAEVSLGDMAQVEALQRVLAEVADTVRPSVVAIRAERRPAASQGEDDRMPDDETHNRFRDRVFPAVGSGVIISPDGLILTNEHVVQNAAPENIVCILSSGQTYKVEGITSDPRSDLAVVSINATALKPIRFGDAAAVRQGHFAIVMGNPYGTASDNYGRPAMSFGVVSAVGQELTRQLDPMGERYYGNLIQTDAKINPGNSGGPLINIRGELIGINTAISTRSGGSEGVGYAIPVDQRIRDIIEHLSRGENVEYGYLGVDLDVPTPSDRSRVGAPSTGGALIRDVKAGTPAAAGNLQSGDVVVEYDGQRVLDRDHLVRLVGSSRVDASVPVVLYRDKRRLTLQVRPDRRPMEIRGINTYASFAWRGMRLAELTPAMRRTHKVAPGAEGVVVVQVEAEGPAQKAGIRPGQVINGVGEVSIKGLRRLREIVPQLAGPLTITLAGDTHQEVTLSE